MRKVFIPSNIKTIDSAAFIGNKNLTEIIANGVERLISSSNVSYPYTNRNNNTIKINYTQGPSGDGTGHHFVGNTSLSRVEMNSLKSIQGENIFGYNTSEPNFPALKELSLPALETITGEMNFTGLLSTERINMPRLKLIKTSHNVLDPSL